MINGLSMPEEVRGLIILFKMKIKTNDGDMNVTGQGQGTYNSIGASLGIASFLGLGANNNGCGGCNNGGILGGLFGGNNNHCCSCPVDQRELQYATALAQCQSERYSDQIARQEAEKAFLEARRVDEKIASVVKETTDALIKTGVAVAENSKELECLKVEVKRNREEAKSYTDAAVTHEAQLRVLGDQNLQAWTEKELCHKIDGELRIPGDAICYGGCKPVLCNTNCLGTANNPLVVEQAVAAAVAAVKATTPSSSSSTCPTVPKGEYK